MTRALRLAERYSDVELLSTQAFLDGDPRSTNPQWKAGKSIYIHTDRVRKMQADIAWAIAYHRGFDQRERVENVAGGFGCVEPLPDKDFKAVREFFEKAVYGNSRTKEASTC